MDEHRASELGDLLDRYDQKLAQARRTHEKSMVEEASQIAAFSKVRKAVIRPALDEICKKLQARGHGVELKQREPDPRSAAYGIGLEMWVLPLGYGKAIANEGDVPRIGFYAAGANRNKVVVHSTNMLPGITGSMGVQGEYSPEELTREIVEREIVRFLKHVFA